MRLKLTYEIFCRYSFVKGALGWNIEDALWNAGELGPQPGRLAIDTDGLNVEHVQLFVPVARAATRS